MGSFKDLAGIRFGRITVISIIGRNKFKKLEWLCQCDCGNTFSALGNDLRTGRTISCGCYKKEMLIRHNTKHDSCSNRLYGVWKSMKQRCTNPNCKDYKNYGNRGICVCDEWFHDFNAFRNWAYSHGYDETAPQYQCTIDRIDPDGNYCPDNCRWVDMKEQRNNQRNSKARRQ